MNQIPIQPSMANFPTGLQAGVMARAIPTPGVAPLSIPAIAGVSDCKNLLSMSPPTLLESYEVYGYSIGAAALLFNSVALASAPLVTLELAFLVNDHPKYAATQLVQTIGDGATNSYSAAAAFTADLVNPLRIEARDRLGIRVGVLSNLATNQGADVLVGIQAATVNTVWTAFPFESTISYNVLEVPAGRRL